MKFGKLRMEKKRGKQLTRLSTLYKILSHYPLLEAREYHHQSIVPPGGENIPDYAQPCGKSNPPLLSSVNCSNGVVFMVITDQYWSMGFDGDEVMTDYVAASDFLSKYEEYALCKFGVIYLAE